MIELPSMPIRAEVEPWDAAEPRRRFRCVVHYGPTTGHACEAHGRCFSEGGAWVAAYGDTPEVAFTLAVSALMDVLS